MYCKNQAQQKCFIRNNKTIKRTAIMISNEQYQLNSKYNLFLRNLVLWSYLYKREENFKLQNLRDKRNYENMIACQEKVQAMLPEIEQLNRARIRSYYPLLNDLALIKYFKDVLNIDGSDYSFKMDKNKAVLM